MPGPHQLGERLPLTELVRATSSSSLIPASSPSPVEEQGIQVHRPDLPAGPNLPASRHPPPRSPPPVKALVLTVSLGPTRTVQVGPPNTVRIKASTTTSRTPLPALSGHSHHRLPTITWQLAISRE